MANNLGSLVVSLGLDAAEFTRGLTKSEYQQQQWARRVETTIEGARTGALAAFAAMGTAVGVLDRQLEGIAGFQDLAEKIGDTAEAVASLKPASDISGTSLDTLAAASVKLTASLAKADDESKGAALGLKAIGLEVEAFKSLSPVEQIDAVAKALAGFEDGAGKTATAVQIFGKSGAELLPFLNDLADGAERQITLTQAQIEAADTYSKTTAALRSELQTLTQVTAADAAPAMTMLAQMLREVTTYSTSAGGSFSLLEAIMAGARNVLQTVIVLGSDVAFVFKQVGVEIGGMAAQVVALANLDFQGFNAISKAMKEDAARARAELDRFQKTILNPVTYGANDQSEAAARRLGLSVAPKRINTRGFGGGGGGSKGAARTGQTEAEKAQKDYDDFQKKLADDTDRALVNRQIRRLEEEEKTQKDYLQRMADNDEALAQYLQRRHEKRFEEEAAAQKKAADDVAKAQQAQADALGDAFSSTFDRLFERGASFGDLLKKLAFDAINIQFLTPATQKLGKTAASAVGSLFDGFFADGGYLPAGKWGIAGERGPEPIFGGRTGLTIQPNAGGQGAGGSMVFNYSIDARGADAGVEARIRAAMAETEARTLAKVQSRANRGGSFAAAVGRA
jgi:hypothetical protein